MGFKPFQSQSCQEDFTAAIHSKALLIPILEQHMSVYKLLIENYKCVEVK